MSDTISVTEFARALDVPIRTVAHWCATGRVDAAKDGGQWRIALAALERELDARAGLLVRATDLESAEPIIRHVQRRAVATTTERLYEAACAYVAEYEAAAERSPLAARALARPLLASAAELAALDDAYVLVLGHLDEAVARGIERGDAMPGAGWLEDPSDPEAARIRDAFARHAREHPHD